MFSMFLISLRLSTAAATTGLGGEEDNGEAMPAKGSVLIGMRGGIAAADNSSDVGGGGDEEEEPPMGPGVAVPL
jgi:hypothetical protein